MGVCGGWELSIWYDAGVASLDDMFARMESSGVGEEGFVRGATDRRIACLVLAGEDYIAGGTFGTGGSSFAFLLPMERRDRQRLRHYHHTEGHPT